jgi:hypothetical protein
VTYLASPRRLNIAAIRPKYVIHDTVLRGRQYVGGMPLLGARGFFVRLNRSFILFVKASSTVPA